MRWMFLIATVFLFSCNQDDNDCETIWNYDVHEIASSAVIDSSELLISCWNPNSIASTELFQIGLEGNFDVAIDIQEFSFDSLTFPQFRMEVYSLDALDGVQAGVAVNRNSFYCYTGSEPDERDIRIAATTSGTMQISREGSILNCQGNFGGVNLSFSDSTTTEDLGVRLVLGSTASSIGNISVRLDNFQIASSLSTIRSDDFSCTSWK